MKQKNRKSGFTNQKTSCKPLTGLMDSAIGEYRVLHPTAPALPWHRMAGPVAGSVPPIGHRVIATVLYGAMLPEKPNFTPS